MTLLLTSGCIFALVLVLMILEACVLIPYYLRTGRGIAPMALLCPLLAGGGLLLAIGAVLLKAPPACIALALCLALLGHAADIKLRWSDDPDLLEGRRVAAKKLNVEQSSQSDPITVTTAG